MGVCCSKLETEQITTEQRVKLNAISYQTADDITYDFTEAKVIRVYDGDTVTVAAFFKGSIYKFNVRIYGVNCEEIKGVDDATKAKAVEAKKFVENLILNKIVNINVLNNKNYGGRKMREKFNRLLAIITYKNKNVADELIKHKLGVPYYGGTK